MKSFAFILHPISIAQVRSLYQNISWLTRHFSDYRVKTFLQYTPNHKIITLNFNDNISGKKIVGHIIVCPYLPTQFASIKSETVQKKILNACKLGEALGAKIIGLGGFTSISTTGGRDLIGNCKAAITNGNTLTTKVTIDSIIHLLRVTEKKLNEQQVLIIGASGDIGSACSKYFAGRVKELFLVARDMEKLKALGQSLGNIKLNLSNNHRQNIKDADIIITATSATTTFIDPKELKAGAILSDVSYPPNINFRLAHLRSDISVYAGGLVRFPTFFAKDSKVKSIFRIFNNAKGIPGCLAETIVLALEENYSNFSLGRGEITTEKMDYISKIAQKHNMYNLIYLSGGEEIILPQT